MIKMWFSTLIRFFRRRIVLGIIFVFSLLYCVINLIHDQKSFNNVDVQVKNSFTFVWVSDLPTNASDSSYSCRNSVQGTYLIVDDKGFVCPRSDLLMNNCCGSGVQYDCESCKSNYCCAIYEYCVSCCLHPGKKTLLQAVLDRAAERHRTLLSSVRDQFELCLMKCRTSSLSVKHENTYRDPQAKHCYADMDII